MSCSPLLSFKKLKWKRMPWLAFSYIHSVDPFSNCFILLFSWLLSVLGTGGKSIVRVRMQGRRAAVLFLAKNLLPPLQLSFWPPSTAALPTRSVLTKKISIPHWFGLLIEWWLGVRISTNFCPEYWISNFHFCPNSMLKSFVFHLPFYHIYRSFDWPVQTIWQMKRHAPTCSCVCALRQLSSLQDPIHFDTSSLSNKTVIAGLSNILVQQFICRSRGAKKCTHTHYTRDPATSGS